MSPSTNLLAIVMAYDSLMPLPDDKEQYADLSRQFLCDIQQTDSVIAPLFDSYRQYTVDTQNRYDALLSIAIDVGPDVLFSFPLPSLVAGKATKTQLKQAIADIPTFQNTLRPGLSDQFRKYGMAVPSRRQIESDLFFGLPTLVMSPVLTPDRQRTMAPMVLHPFLRFLSARR